MDNRDETTKRQEYACAWLCGCKPKSVSAGLDCDLGCRPTPVLSATHSAVAAIVCGLHGAASVPHLCLTCSVYDNDNSELLMIKI